METFNQWAKLWKRSVEEVAQFGSTMQTEFTKRFETQTETTKELMDLGLQTQNKLMDEFIKNTQTATEMFKENVGTVKKFWQENPVKPAKAS